MLAESGGVEGFWPHGHEMICFSWIRVIDMIFARWSFETRGDAAGIYGTGGVEEVSVLFQT